MIGYEHPLGLGIRLAVLAMEHSTGGHQLTLVPEEPAPGTEGERTWGVRIVEGRIVDERGSWASPFVRAVCSCGWRAGDDDRFTIEENAVHHWRTTHIAEVPARG